MIRQSVSRRALGTYLSPVPWVVVAMWQVREPSLKRRDLIRQRLSRGWDVTGTFVAFIIGEGTKSSQHSSQSPCGR